MKTRWPLVPTILVALAMLAMIGLGVWQLQRRAEKAALLKIYSQNLGKEISFPELPPVPDAALFRLSSVNCLRVTGWRIEGGRAADGSTGYRRIAECSTGAEGPGALVDIGISREPQGKQDWRGGRIAGRITTEPVKSSLVAQLFGRPVPPRPLLVATTPAPGLAASAPPSPVDIPDNHLAYAFQWFAFAGMAGLIYWLALRRRRRVAPPPPPA